MHFLQICCSRQPALFLLKPVIFSSCSRFLASVVSSSYPDLHHTLCPNVPVIEMEHTFSLSDAVFKPQRSRVSAAKHLSTSRITIAAVDWLRNSENPGPDKLHMTRAARHRPIRLPTYRKSNSRTAKASRWKSYDRQQTDGAAAMQYFPTA
jgi:hypothetical protein